MKNWVIYTDGSFGDNGEVHGGIVYWGKDGMDAGVHIKCTLPEFVSMRNVGGEILAAWAAIMSCANIIKQEQSDKMESYRIDLIYDYEGVGKWINGLWKTKAAGTRWFVNSIREIKRECPTLTINTIWVRGHAGTSGNNVADLVAAYDMGYCKSKNIPICNLDEVLKL